MKTINIPLSIIREQNGICSIYCPFRDSYNNRCLLFKEKLEVIIENNYKNRMACISCNEVAGNYNP